jgi:hypothetical protein
MGFVLMAPRNRQQLEEGDDPDIRAALDTPDDPDITAALEAAPPAQQTEEPGYWRQALDKVVNGYATLSDGTAAALNTGTFGLSGRALEAIGGMSQRAMNERSPYATAIGSTGAAVFSPVNKLAAPVQGASALARVGRAALVNGALGAAGGAQQAHDEGRSELQGGGWGAALGLLTGGAGQAIGEGVQAAGKGAHWLADKARNVVAGVGAREARPLMEAHGLDAADQLGRNLEELVPPRWYGRSSRGYAEELGKMLGDEAAPAAGTLRGDLRNLYGAAGADPVIQSLAPGAQQQMASRAAQEAAALRGSALADVDEQRAAALQRIADRLSAAQPGGLDALVRAKAGLQAAGHTGGGSTIGDKASEWAAARAGRIGKEELEGVMTAGAPQQMRAEWRDLSDRMSKAAALEEMTRNKAGAEITAGDVGTALLGSAVGAGAGYLGSQLSDADDTAGAMALGTGLGGAMFSGTRNAFRQAAGSWGSDVAANAFRGAGNKLTNAGQAIQSGTAPFTSAVDRMVAGLLAQREDDDEEALR